MVIRIFHTGKSNTAIFLADLDLDDAQNQPDLPKYVPVGGFIELSLDRYPVRESFESGNLRGFINNGFLTVSVPSEGSSSDTDTIVVWVSNAGDDTTGDGTPSNPVATLKRARDIARSQVDTTRTTPQKKKINVIYDPNVRVATDFGTLPYVPYGQVHFNTCNWHIEGISLSMSDPNNYAVDSRSPQVPLEVIAFGTGYSFADFYETTIGSAGALENDGKAYGIAFSNLTDEAFEAWYNSGDAVTPVYDRTDGSYDLGHDDFAGYDRVEPQLYNGHEALDSGGYGWEIQGPDIIVENINFNVRSLVDLADEFIQVLAPNPDFSNAVRNLGRSLIRNCFFRGTGVPVSKHRAMTSVNLTRLAVIDVDMQGGGALWLHNTRDCYIQNYHENAGDNGYPLVIYQDDPESPLAGIGFNVIQGDMPISPNSEAYRPYILWYNSQMRQTNPSMPSILAVDKDPIWEENGFSLEANGEAYIFGDAAFQSFDYTTGVATTKRYRLKEAVAGTTLFDTTGPTTFRYVSVGNFTKNGSGKFFANYFEGYAVTFGGGNDNQILSGTIFETLTIEDEDSDAAAQSVNFRNLHIVGAVSISFGTNTFHRPHMESNVNVSAGTTTLNGGYIQGNLALTGTATVNLNGVFVLGNVTVPSGTTLNAVSCTFVNAPTGAGTINIS